MNLSLGSTDAIGFGVGLILTLMVFTYILGDNFLFRLAVSLFIGVSAGFVVGVVLSGVIIDQVVFPILINPASVLPWIIFPLALGLLLLFKISPRLSPLANPVMAFVVGVGAATAIGGAVVGTILPQIGAMAGAFDLQAFQATVPAGESPIAQTTLAIIRGFFVLGGAVTTLAYFQFGARPAPDGTMARPAPVEWLAKIGQFFIVVTLGTIFAGVYAAALAALIERLYFIIQFISQNVHL